MSTVIIIIIANKSDLWNLKFQYLIDDGFPFIYILSELF